MEVTLNHSPYLCMANQIVQLKNGNDNIYPQMPVKTGSITPASGVTLSEQRVVQVGKIVEVHFYAEGVAASGDHVIATISGVDLPPRHIRTLVGVGSAAYAADASLYGLLSSVNGEMHINGTTNNVAVVDIVYTVN